MMGTPLALIAAGLLAWLVMGFLPDRKADAGQAVATPVAATEVIAPTVTASPTAEGSPTTSASPTASGSRTASAAATTAPARPSATGKARTASAAAPLAGRIRPKVAYRGRHLLRRRDRRRRLPVRPHR